MEKEVSLCLPWREKSAIQKTLPYLYYLKSIHVDRYFREWDKNVASS